MNSHYPEFQQPTIINQVSMGYLITHVVSTLPKQKIFEQAYSSISREGLMYPVVFLKMSQSIGWQPLSIDPC